MVFGKLAERLTLGLALVCLPAVAHAYIGPGAGLSAIGTAIAVIGSILLLVVGFVWYPVKRLLRGKKAAAVQKNEGGSPEG